MLIKTCDKHYYDENEIEIGKPIQCRVVVNHTTEPTQYPKLQKRHKSTAKKETQVQQPSLFDF